MNTPLRNRHGLYDAPRLNAVREPFVLTQADLQRQLEDGAFDMDSDEALRCGLVSPYDDETEKILVNREENHESGS
jgi:hypothetical protein